MQRLQKLSDTAWLPCAKSQKVESLMSYIEELRQSLAPKVTSTLIPSYSPEDFNGQKLPKPADTFETVYQVLQNLKFEFNPESNVINIEFLSETDRVFYGHNVDIDSKEFCFAFMTFLAEWTHAVMAAMQYFTPSGWCKVPFWKALKEIRNKAFDIFAYSSLRQPAYDTPKQIHIRFEQFTKAICEEKQFYSELYCDVYSKSNGKSPLLKKIGKVYGVLDAFEVSILSQNHFRFHFDYGQTPSDIGPVSGNDQAFWYAILNFYAYLYYKARSLQADAPPTIVEQQKINIQTLFAHIVNMMYNSL